MVASDFALTRYTKGQKTETVTLSQYRGRAVLLNFWASWCRVCKLEKPLLHQLQNEHKDLVVLSILTHDANADIAQIAEMPFLDDRQAKLTKIYKINSLPQTFLLDAKQNIRWHSRGALNTRTYQILSSLVSSMHTSNVGEKYIDSAFHKFL